MATVIKTLKDKDGNIVLPRTRVEAVTLADGETSLEDSLIVVSNDPITTSAIEKSLTFNSSIYAPRTLASAVLLDDGITSVQDALDNLSASAEDISIVDVGEYFVSTDVEGALQEIGFALDNLSADADAISFTPTQTILATDVQGAIEELDSNKLDLTGGTVIGDVNITGNNFVTGNIKITGNNQSTEFIQSTTGLTLTSTIYGGTYRLPRVYAQTSETAPSTMQNGDLLFIYVN